MPRSSASKNPVIVFFFFLSFLIVIFLRHRFLPLHFSFTCQASTIPVLCLHITFSKTYLFPVYRFWNILNSRSILRCSLQNPRRPHHRRCWTLTGQTCELSGRMEKRKIKKSLMFMVVLTTCFPFLLKCFRRVLYHIIT